MPFRNFIRTGVKIIHDRREDSRGDRGKFPRRNTWSKMAFFDRKMICKSTMIHDMIMIMVCESTMIHDM